AVGRYQALVRPLINQSARVGDDRKLSYTDATSATMLALYSQGTWPQLNEGLLGLAQNRADKLLDLSDQYYGRQQNGSYSTRMDVFQSVLCLDYPPVKDPTAARDLDDRLRKAAPFLDSGQPLSSALDYCAFWPVPPTSGPHHPQIPADLPTVM